MSMWLPGVGRACALAALTTGLAGCSGDQDWLPSPTPEHTRVLPQHPEPPPVPPGGEVTVTGRVVEFTASGMGRPVPNLRLKVQTIGPGDGGQGGTPLPDVITDGDGRYEITGGPPYVLFVQTAPGSNYRFLCDFYPLFTRGLGPHTDLPVVHVTWSGDRLPPGIGNAGTSVYGVVSERAGDTVHGLGGATVTLDNGNSDPPAITNAAGFYMVCSIVGSDQFRTITARKDGYDPVVRQIVGGWDFHVDLELVRP